MALIFQASGLELEVNICTLVQGQILKVWKPEGQHDRQLVFLDRKAANASLQASPYFKGN